MANNSILTNPAALVALRNLERTNRSLEITQERVSTGLRVNGAKDDASNFAIAQGIRGDLRALTAINQGLNNTKGIAKVALAGATAISNLLQDIRQKLTELSNEGVTTQQRIILRNVASVRFAITGARSANLSISRMTSPRPISISARSPHSEQTLTSSMRAVSAQDLFLGFA